MIVEPDGISKIQERKIPHVVRNMLISVAPIIIPLKVFEKGLAIAAGSVRSAMTRMIPTTWINTTTETEDREQAGLKFPRTLHQRPGPVALDRR